MEAPKEIKTLGDLRASGWKDRSVKQELAENLLEKIRRGEELFPGILGYDQTVIPELENAILSGHDLIILGERGQAKSRIIRGLVNFLDEWMPAVEGCEINDNPYHPVCAVCRAKAIELGDRLPIRWIHRSERYGEKLATPDVSMADLIGDIDPIKIAEGRYLSDQSAIHFGLLPRCNRGIFAINELPDLSEKVQVGLFNILEERDIQIKGYKFQLPLDIYIVATANPEDYTNRGKIITPLKDRYSSQVRTHYPKDIETEIAIIEQEAQILLSPEEELRIPKFIKEIIAEITFEARKSPEVNQSSGVSVRMSISNYENIISSARKRALQLGENLVVPRLTDLSAIYPSSRGKIELEYTGEERSETELIEIFIARAIKKVFDRYFQPEEFSRLLQAFERGAIMEVSSEFPSKEYMDLFQHFPELKEFLSSRLKISLTPPELASACELILEGLHLNQKLNRQLIQDKYRYQKSQTMPRKGPDGAGKIYL